MERKLGALHRKCLEKSDPLAPVKLEVIDHATHEALQRMIAAGLISTTTRASRPLLADSDPAIPSPLSEEERKKAETCRLTAARKLKMARLLGQGGFAGETREALLDAVLQLACALAVENRLPEPPDIHAAIQPPLSHFWKERLPQIRDYLGASQADWEPILQTLETQGS
jgi:hypothetical protein